MNVRFVHALVVLAIVHLIAVSCVSAVNNTHTFSINNQFNVLSVESWSPKTLAIDAKGNIFFKNELISESVIHLNNRGKHVSTLRTTPAGDITAVAVGSENQLIYIADDLGRRIVLMTADNVQVASFPYIMPMPYSVKQLLVDSRGVMYMIDSLHEQVWRMNSTGAALPALSTNPVLSPTYMALDDKNVLYVADQMQSRIYQYSTRGEQIGILVNPLIRLITALAVDHHFNVYIASGLYQRDSPGITKFSPDGSIISFYPQIALSLVVDIDNSLYITCANGVISKFDANMSDLLTIATPSSHKHFTSMLVDPVGNLIVINDSSLGKYSSTGSVLTMNVTNGTFSKEANFGILGRDGYVYVADLAGQVVKLSTNGIFMSSLWLDSPVQSVSIRVFAVDIDSTLWISTPSCQCIIQYSADGKVMRRLMSGLDPKLMFVHPDLLYIDSFNHLFVLDVVSNMLYKLNNDGQLLWSFHLDGFCSFASSFTVDVHGDVYVVDTYHNHFLHILISANNTVIDYRFTDITINQSIIAVNSRSVVYLSDKFARIIVLIPFPEPPMSSYHIMFTIVLVSIVAFLVGILAVAIVCRRIYINQSINQSFHSCDDVFDVTCHHERPRRSGNVKLLSHYHDNLRMPIMEDEVLYL